MKVGAKVGLVVTFFVVLLCVGLVGTIQTTKDSEYISVNAAEMAKKEDYTQPVTQKPTAPITSPVQSAFSKEKLEKLEKTVDAELKENNFNGTVLIAVGDEVVLHKARGYSNKVKKTKNDLDTKYEIGSVTKQFTAVAIAKLADEGKLSLNDKMDKYFPDFREGKKVTIENLIRMESGVPDYLNFNIGMIERGEYEEDSVYTQKDFLKWLNKQELGFTPGEYFYYSNTNYYMLGMIIEQVTGEKYEDYIVNKILNPLYMYDTSMKMTDTTAKGYLEDGTDGIKIDSSYFYSAGEMVSTTSDMLRWLNAFSRQELLSANMQKKALAKSKAGNSYGFGWFLCGDYYYHTGNTELFYAIDLIEERNDIKIIALSNINDINVQAMGKELLTITINGLFPEQKITKAT